jgi:hypothetical protein
VYDDRHLDSLSARSEELNMPILDEPLPDPTHYRVLLTDPEGTDRIELQRLLEDCGLKVLGIEELSWSEIEIQGKKASEKAGLVPRTDRKAG